MQGDADTPRPTVEDLARRLADPAFLEAVCHDLRGPLGAIGTWIHVLGSGRADAATQQEALAAMQRDVGAQTRLIEQLSDLSSILAGTLLLSIEEVDLVSLLHELGATLQATMASPMVLADRKRLLQLLAILLPVGGRAAAEDPVPVLAADYEGPRTLLIRGRTRKGVPGFVGLTLAQALADLQAGHLTTSPGAEGTAFVVRLPTPEGPLIP